MRRFQTEDIDMQFDILYDKRLAQFISFPDLTREEELEWIERQIKIADTSEYEKRVIECKEQHIPIGNISVNAINKKDNYCNVGYVIRYKYWGKGYATEALKTISDYLLNKRNYYLVERSCNELNLRSSRVMIKAGFKKDGYIANRRKNRDGTYSKVEYYSRCINDSL